MTIRPSLRLEGVIPPMISPLTFSGNVDTAAINRLVESMITAGVSGVFVLGSSGEGPWLTPSQQQHVIEQTVKAAARRVPVLAGVIEPSTPRTLEAIRRAEAVGADAVVVASPYYFGADAGVQRNHVEAAAHATLLPIVLYNIPTTTYNLIAPETVRHLLEVPTVVAIKDSAGDMDAFAQLLELRALKAGFAVLQGAEVVAAQSMLMGADGLVPGMGNLVPQLFCQIVTHARAGRRAEAEALQAQITALSKLHGYSYWLEGLKYAASCLGFGSGACVGRVATLSESSRTTIRQLVETAVSLDTDQR